MLTKTVLRSLNTTVCLALLLAGTDASATAAWYGGTISRIFVHSDGFIVTVNGAALDDCLHQYAYFRVSDLGDKVVDRALALALAAQASGRTFRTVIDKAINGPGGECRSNGSADITG